MSQTKNPHVWGNIRHVFNPAILNEIQISEEYLNIDSEQVLEASRVREGLVEIISGVQEQSGLGPNILEATQGQRTRFAEDLKSNPQWLSSFSKILGLFDVDAEPSEVVQNLNRPWWNALQVNLANDSYSPKSGYGFTGKVSHSFIAQLGDAGLKTKGKLKYDVQTNFQPVSVGNLLFTSDNKLVLGYRGGQNFPDVVHVMPCGSAEPHLKRGAVWGSFDLEHKEELNFSKKEYSSAEFVAVATESLMAKGKWHYWVFRTKTPMTSEQVKNHWQTAVDRKEHDHLEVYDANPEKILDEIATNFWDITKADPKSYATTTSANKGTWLPQCSVSVLASYAQQRGKDWAKHAEQKLDGHYDLTSCFENSGSSKNE